MPGLQLRYLVLKPKGKDIFAEASRVAMREYAKVIWDKNPELALEITTWANEEWAEARVDSMWGEENEGEEGNEA